VRASGGGEDDVVVGMLVDSKIDLSTRNGNVRVFINSRL
jgi:hypothetical protein